MNSTPAQRWSEHPELVEFFTTHRSGPQDVYPSERRFLGWLARHSASVLDVGCAAGGFRNVWRHYNSSIRYTGVDLSASLITAARRRYPDCSFLRADCAAGVDLPDGAAHTVASLGVLHWEPRYQAMLREMWRLCSQFIFFDCRLVELEHGVINGAQQLSFFDRWDGKTTTPYICVSWSDFAGYLLSFNAGAIYGCGYWGKPAKTVLGISAPVCFASFVLQTAGAGTSAPLTCLDLPLQWPAELRSRVELLPAGHLARLIPES